MAVAAPRPPDDVTDMLSGRGEARGNSADRRLVEAAAAQVVGDDHVGHGVEHELDVVGVGGARHVAVDLLGGGFVLGFELSLDVRCRFAVFLRT